MTPKDLLRAIQWISIGAYVALIIHTMSIQRNDMHQIIILALVLGNGVYLLNSLNDYCAGKDAWIYAAYLNGRHEEATKSMIIIVLGLGIVFTCLAPIFLQRGQL